MIYYVFAETTGFLTLPPGTTSIKVDQVEIRLADETQKSSEQYTSPVLCNGVEVNHTGKKAPVELLISATVEAQTKEEAMKIGKAVIESALDLVFLISATPISTVFVFNAIRKMSENKFNFSQRALITNRDVLVWNERSEERIPIFKAGIDRLTEKNRKHFLNAIRWRRKGAFSNESDVQFLFFWFAIEALSQMSFVQATNREHKCIECKKPLVCTCGVKQSGETTAARIQGLLVDTTGLWSKKECQNGYRLRSKVAHGNIGISPEEEKDIERTIPKLNDAIHELILKIFNYYYPPNKSEGTSTSFLPLD